MVFIIAGKKGTGKTKRLIESANQAVAQSKGNVAVIVKGNKLTYDISHDARLIDIDSYGVQGAEALGGFLCGLCAGNYDLTDIFVDSTLKITGHDMKAVSALIKKVKALSEFADTRVTLLLSADADELPEDISAICSVV